MNINGTLINYYFHCKRQCWLHGNRINLEDNSESVKIGKAIHEIKANKSKQTEIAIDNIKIDKLTNEYLIELKKSDADVEASKWQLLFYLKVLKDKGIDRKGKLEFVEKNKTSNKIIYLELDDKKAEYLNELALDIEKLLLSQSIPEAINEPKCKKCAYYEYCYI
ncbi:CRISPR-associated protein Cas4 [Proteiniborus sp.]|uniref:CRISPR-associated protein Cas4 n=1 Tax=Proteiniborus sp. TaxID=2079015 RepID=UPI0033249FBB